MDVVAYVQGECKNYTKGWDHTYSFMFNRIIVFHCICCMLSQRNQTVGFVISLVNDFLYIFFSFTITCYPHTFTNCTNSQILVNINIVPLEKWPCVSIHSSTKYESNHS